MDTELRNTQNGANDGNRAIGVPSFQFNAGADWDVPGLQGVALNARMLRTGGHTPTRPTTSACRPGTASMPVRVTPSRSRRKT
jgi:hypothetical protein